MSRGVLLTHSGSSPHARGTLAVMLTFTVSLGIIPACAGNTQKHRRHRRMLGDHPRMRGEHTAATRPPNRLTGSSPHARGTPHHSGLGCLGLGIIPACAGNTASSSLARLSSWDHPRMRGEHLFPGQACGRPSGSSPHARGTRDSTPSIRFKCGIIPACAGNTRRSACRFGIIRDHPRMRGEHERSQHGSPQWTGSSPHARGTLSFRTSVRASTGIIPACAGNTPRAIGFSLSGWDHPRMRGEHCGRNLGMLRFLGSSPHARGTPSHSVQHIVDTGIIPACAGNTFSTSETRLPNRDHPRMRGEHATRAASSLSWVGSSPHARGTH